MTSLYGVGTSSRYQGSLTKVTQLAGSRTRTLALKLEIGFKSQLLTNSDTLHKLVNAEP